MHPSTLFLQCEAMLFKNASCCSTSNHELCGVIMFNLALLFHSDATAGCTDFMANAIRLYELILQLLAETNTNSMVASHLRVVLLNNLGVFIYVQAHKVQLFMMLQDVDADVNERSADRREMIANCFCVLAQEQTSTDVFAKATPKRILKSIQLVSRLQDSVFPLPGVGSSCSMIRLDTVSEVHCIAAAAKQLTPLICR